MEQPFTRYASLLNLQATNGIDIRPDMEPIKQAEDKWLFNINLNCYVNILLKTNHFLYICTAAEVKEQPGKKQYAFLTLTTVLIFYIESRLIEVIYVLQQIKGSQINQCTGWCFYDWH